jgi:hypothetical protein
MIRIQIERIRRRFFGDALKMSQAVAMWVEQAERLENRQLLLWFGSQS